MDNKQLFDELCTHYDFNITNDYNDNFIAIPKSNYLKFSGYILKLENNKLYIADFPDIEDTQVYFCGQLDTIDLDCYNKINLILDTLHQKEKELKDLENQKELDKIKEDF